MPTLEHNALVEMFRGNPPLAPHLIETLFHQQLPAYTSVDVSEPALDQLVPVEFRADLVLDLKDAQGGTVLAIVLEAQRSEDPDKKFSWPVYVTVVRAKKRCPAIVLVVAPNPEVAAWSAEPIELGLGRGRVEPLVLGPKALPKITDQALASREVELAVLSAVAHGNEPDGLDVAYAAFVALQQIDQEHAAAYFQIVYDVLREPVRRALEKLIMERTSDTSSPAPSFTQRLVELGEIKAKRSTLLRLLTRTGITLSDEERDRIEACDDIPTLDRWFDNAFGARTAADVLR